jgi:RNase P subunit RPR2
MESSQKTEKRARGRPLGCAKTVTEYKDRFQKHYYKHRDEISERRRNLYDARKKAGFCVNCGGPRARGDALFCKHHRKYTTVLHEVVGRLAT